LPSAGDNTFAAGVACRIQRVWHGDGFNILLIAR
jgi:hypothetical protein